MANTHHINRRNRCHRDEMTNMQIAVAARYVAKKAANR
jgi:hypothetical protein